MLDTSRAKIERAKEQIADLKSEIDAFFKSGAYAVVEERDGQTEERVFRLKINRPIPLRFAVIVGEIIHDLRSSLDQLICHLIVTNKGKITGQSGFPIYRCRQKFECRAAEKITGAGTDVVRIIQEVKPYRGGNDSLLKLHLASNSEKHVLPVLVGTAYDSRSYDPTAVLRASGAEVRPMTWVITGKKGGQLKFPLQSGDEVFRAYAQAEDTYNFTFLVAFSQADVFKCEPLIPTLLQLADVTEDTLKLFDRLLPESHT